MQSDRIGRVNVLGTAAALAALLLWSIGPIFVRYLSAYLDAWTQNLWRYTVATMFWLPFLFLAGRRGQLNPSIWKRAIIPSLGNIIMQCLFVRALYLIEPGFGTLLLRSSLIWTITFSLIYFPEERKLITSGRFWTGMILSVAGMVVVIVAKEGFTARASLIGTTLMLISAVAWALYIVSARIAFRNIDSRIGFSVVSLYTVIGLAFVAVILGRPGQILELPPWPWICVVVSGILCISIAHTLYYTSMQRIGTTIPVVLLQLHPFLVILFSMIIFTERLNLYQWIGGIALVGGSVLSIWAQQHLGKPQPAPDSLPD